MGKQMINSAPLPCAVCALMVPPIISTMFLVIAIPRPVPWILNTAKKLYKAFEKAQAQHNNNMQIFYHDSDRFSTKYCFEAESLPDRCPACGKAVYQSRPAIRPAIEKEVRNLLRTRDEEWE